jgi:hypothetical protein
MGIGSGWIALFLVIIVAFGFWHQSRDANVEAEETGMGNSQDKRDQTLNQ